MDPGAKNPDEAAPSRDPLTPVEARLIVDSLPPRVRRALRQLLASESCRAALEAVDPDPGPADSGPADPGPASAPAPPEPGPDSAYDAVFESFERRLANAGEAYREEHRRAAPLVALLTAEPVERWPELLAANPELRSLPVIPLLLEGAEPLAATAPRTAEARGLFALLLLDRLETSLAQDPMVLALRARAWALVGQARATGADAPGAEEAFRAASRLFADNLQSDDEASFLTLFAGVLERQQRLPEALALLARAADLYGELGCSRCEAHVLAEQARLLFHTGDLERAPGPLAWALLLVEREGADPALAARLRRRLARFLLADDRVAEAREVLAGAAAGSPVPAPDRVPADPLEQFLAALADLGPHPAALGELRRRLVRAYAEGESYEVALAGLLLARQYLREERRSELMMLVPYLLGAAGSGQLATGSRQALTHFCEALLEGAASLPLLVDTAASLRPALETETAAIQDATQKPH